MNHSIAAIALTPSGYEGNITGSTWLCMRNNETVYGNGKVAFAIPKQDHQEVATQYYFAKKAGTLTKLWVTVGRKYGRNGGTPNTQVVSTYIRNIVKAQGGEV